ncbi:MAG: sugar phosphate isomerase/epimerase family protein [Lachnospiraceae bacterium]
MKKSVQQIMIGTLTSTEERASWTLQKVREFGFDAIELNGFMVRPTPMLVRLMTKAAGMPVGNGGKLNWPVLIQNAGLEVTSLHESLGAIKDDPKFIVSEAKKYNTDIVVVTGMYRFDYSDTESVQKLAEDLNRSGKILQNDGIRLLYHNHNCEFQKVTEDKSAFSILLEETDPDFVNFEFDSYWAAEAGVDVIAFMQQLDNRIKLYHINDRGCRKKGPYTTPILKSDSMELGSGNMNLTAMVDQARSAGVETVVLETHRNWIDKSPLKSIEVSSEFMKKI